jgi:putative acetyltransferase
MRPSADNVSLLIRPCQPGEELALYKVFHSSVHQLAQGYYGSEQLAAWAPEAVDGPAWIAKIRALRPLVAADGVQLLGYADLQADGYIDHFYVAGAHAGRGVGAALLRHLVAAARVRGLAELSAHVSLCAEGFFARAGFEVRERCTVLVRGVALANARMGWRLGCKARPTAHSTSSL